MDQDDDVVQQARAGDPDAWEFLYRRVYPRLRSYLTRRVGIQAAEDAVSETMARAVAGLDRMEVGPAGFDGWVFGIARRVAADHYRRDGRTRRQDRAARGIEGPSVSVDISSEQLELRDEYSELSLAFSKLTDAERELLEFRVVAGLSAEQTAEVLGKRPGAVRTAQSRALARLRSFLDEEVKVP